MAVSEYDEVYATRQLNRSRNPLRRLVKGFYLRDLLKDVVGPTIDFGCGAGQLLARLPEKSIGLEVNAALVKHLRAEGKNVQLYIPERDKLSFSDLMPNLYQTFVMSHVLEHFEDAADGLRQILRACDRLGVKRLIVIVPGWKGYAFDETHRSFVNPDYLKKHSLLKCGDYSVAKMCYFPINVERIGSVFTFHELKVVYDKS